MLQKLHFFCISDEEPLIKLLGVSVYLIPDVVVCLTVVELAVWLLTIDDVEAVGSSNTHAAHLKVEPLVVVITVDVWIQHKVILVSGENTA